VIYAILFLVLPLFAAFLTPVGSLIRSKFGNILNLLVYAAGIFIGGYLISEMDGGANVILLGGWRPPYGINLYLSSVSIGFGILVYVIALFIQMNDLNRERPGRYNLLFSLFVFASLGMMQTGDLFNLFVFIEIGTIAVLALAPTVSMKSGTRGAVKYLVLSGLLSMIMLAGIALLYSSLGTLNIAHIASSGALNGALAFLIGIGVLSLLFFEAELFPFNAWVPDLYKGAPSAVSGAVAGIGGLSGVVVLGRLFMTMMGRDTSFQFANGRLLILVFCIAVASILIGEVAALKERDLKKMLAFSSVGQMGVVVLTFTAGSVNAVYAGLFLLVNHSVMKPMLLLLAGFFIGATGSSKWDAMRGAGRRYPVFGALFILGGLSLMGMPIFAGFWGKMILLKSLFDGASALTLVGAAAVLFSVIIEGIYFLRAGHSLFESEADTTSGSVEKKQLRGSAVLTFIPAIVFALVTVVLGIRPGILSFFLNSASSDLVGTAEYIRNVLMTVSNVGGGL
jgi:formate hydrogenlyase subunit 3/multisubunit Na+/H+ antiporter MnhD subunit